MVEKEVIIGISKVEIAGVKRPYTFSKRNGNTIIGMTSDVKSYLAKIRLYSLHSNTKEACPHNLAPTNYCTNGNR